MHAPLSWLGCAVALWVLAVCPAWAVATSAEAEAEAEAKAAQAADAADRAVLAGLTQAIQANPALDADRKQSLLHTLDAAGTGSGARQDAAAAVLSDLYPDFARAMAALGDEDPAGASALLRPLTAAPDPYLAAHAGFFLARACVAAGDFDSALPLLQDEGRFARYTLSAGEALFLKGVCLRRTLHRPEAMNAFVAFLEKYPAAPERLRVGALHQAYELELTKDGSLDDISDRMQFSQDRLERAQSDRPVTQAEQARIVAILDKLIKEKEDQENQQGGGGAGGRGRGGRSARGPRANTNKPSSPANQSMVRPGQVPDPNLQKLRGSDPSWVRDREREREKVFKNARGRVSDRDRELVEQYFKNLMEPDAPPSAEPTPK